MLYVSTLGCYDLHSRHKTTVVVEPKNLCKVHVSPRQRAHTTFHLLFEHTGTVPDHVLTEDVAEWDYGT